VLFLSCVCVGVGGVVLCRCVCVCDLLIFLQQAQIPARCGSDPLPAPARLLGPWLRARCRPRLPRDTRQQAGRRARGDRNRRARRSLLAGQQGAKLDPAVSY